jgi:hypothetical protein
MQFICTMSLVAPNSCAISDWVKPLLNSEITLDNLFSFSMSMGDRFCTCSGLILDFAVALEVIPEVSFGLLCNDEFILCNYCCVKIAFMPSVLDTIVSNA